MKLSEVLKRQELSEEQFKRMTMFLNPTEITLINKHIMIGKYTVSIQCSAGHYCEPRTTLKDLSEYTRMEMALWIGGGGDFLKPNNFSDFEQIEELKESFNSGVYAWLEIEVIENFLNYLQSKE